jgi:hypothetical protein
MTDYATSVVEASATCLLCKGVTTAVAVEADFERWFCEGEFIQVAMPEAPVWTREVFMGWRSGAFICEACSAAADEE